MFIEPLDPLTPEQLDTRLYVLRRLIEKAMTESGICGHELFYICSLDRRKIVYKGLLTCKQLQLYYPDLSNPESRPVLFWSIHVLGQTRWAPGSWRILIAQSFIMGRSTHCGEI